MSSNTLQKKLKAALLEHTLWLLGVTDLNAIDDVIVMENTITIVLEDGSKKSLEITDI